MSLAIAHPTPHLTHLPPPSLPPSPAFPPSLPTTSTATDVTDQALRAKRDPTRKVQRLRPGEMPAWVGDAEEEEGFAAASAAAPPVSTSSHRGSSRASRWEGGHGETVKEEEYMPAQTVQKEDRRLLRLEQARQVALEGRKGRGGGGGAGEGGEGGRRRRPVYEAEVIEGGGEGVEEEEEEDEEREERRRRARRRERGTDDEEEEEREEDEFVAGDLAGRTVKLEVGGGGEEGGPVDEDDEDAIARRRAAIREKLKNLRMEEEAAAAAAAAAATKPESDEEEEDEEEEDSEYETDSDDESEEEGGGGGGLFALPRPVFIPKHKRELVQQREQEEREEAEKERKTLLAKEQRRRETRNLVAEEVRKEAEGAAALEGGGEDGYGSDVGAPDDTDRPEEDALEFENWRLRELGRVKRDKEVREARAREKAEVARRRAMTEGERDAEDRRLGRGQYAKVEEEKTKRRFMQKYYHKGAFYMDEESVREGDDVRRRRADEATGEDKFNRAALPAVMQVKKFGRAGQTKYTHLLDQDTTRAEVRF